MERSTSGRMSRREKRRVRRWERRESYIEGAMEE